MGQQDDAPLTPATTPATTPAITPATVPVTVAPPVPVDNSLAQAALEDLQMQESVLAQILAVIDEAGQAVSTGAPDWVDPDVFGGTRKGERMARHTIGAQVRVQEALDLALAALAQHQEALSVFRDDVRRVEAATVDELAAVQARVGSVTS